MGQRKPYVIGKPSTGMERNHGDGGTTMIDFMNTHGYFPATVTDAEKRDDGWTLITIGKDKGTDIFTFLGERGAIRRAEMGNSAE